MKTEEDVKLMQCPKCQNEMRRRSRLNKECNGVEKVFFLCRCGYAINEGETDGYWVK